MRHFDFLPDADWQRLFHRVPEAFDAGCEPALLAVALGATLYSPATRPRLGRDFARLAADGVTSVVACLEDAVADVDVAAAEANLVEQLRWLDTATARPLVFVRVRTPQQVARIVDGLAERAGVLAGFVLPKFGAACGPEFLDAVVSASAALDRRLLVMPVLESREIAFAESRLDALLGVRELLDKFRDFVLAVRLGATDLCAPFGLRRSPDITIYNVGLVASIISDVVNVFGRADGGYVVSGPVWEYFPTPERLFKPQLRDTPFRKHDERKLRVQLIANDLDGLIREVALDRANGLTGKTVIHPSHVAAVHALSVVTHEEYVDALDIVGTANGGGVSASAYRNKMNESKPHTAWAQRTLVRARVFGVAQANISFVDLLGASLHL